MQPAVATPLTSGQRIAAWMRYLYYLRVSFSLLLFAPLVVALNWTAAKTLLSGIVTAETWQENLCVAFFVVTGGFASLIMARVVVINGEERFGDKPPASLHRLLAGDRGRDEALTLLLFQLPGLLVFISQLLNAASAGVALSVVSLGALLGAMLAFALWWVVNALYYLTYERPEGSFAAIRLGQNAARTILLPRAWFPGLGAPGETLDHDSLESVQTPLTARIRTQRNLRLTASRLKDHSSPGYRFADGRIYEAHAFTAVATAAFFALYDVLWPMTAPIPVANWSYIFYAVFMVLPGIFAIFLLARSNMRNVVKLRSWQIFFITTIVAFLASVLYLYESSDASRFPIFALLLIVMILLCWFLGGLAFWGDRFRVPVITMLLLVLIGPRLLFGKWIHEDHYLSTTTYERTGHPLPTPREIVLGKLAATSASSAPTPDLKTASTNTTSATGAQPLIVVTATGGGLHASAWTTGVLGHLEKAFHRQTGTSFHEHVLLMSTVSGGSVGLLNYLHGIDEEQPNQPPDVNAMQDSASCSSLEAVGWGLVYFDLPRALLPIPLIWPSRGLGDLMGRPLGKDRTWALRRAIMRNMHDVSCATAERTQGRLLSERRQLAAHTLDELRHFTLANMVAIQPDLKKPAITMNTTTVEGGKRFLSANYTVGCLPLGAFESQPAQSFLDVYGGAVPVPGCPSAPSSGLVVDLPLATAAQMSATFPIVSSAARISPRVRAEGLHFIDGGYYDNDGTGSAIEFLRSALDSLPQDHQPLRIILVEIRNSPDCQDNTPPANTNSLNLFGQLTAPLLGFWSAGHESQTDRDRVALDILLRDYPTQLQLQRIVIDDRWSAHRVGTDPLNWYLTPMQRNEVRTSLELVHGKVLDVVNAWRNFGPPAIPGGMPTGQQPAPCSASGA